MQKLVFINGNGKEIDLTSGNFGIVNWEGFANTALNIQTQQVPFEDGGVYLDALMEQREIAVSVAIYDGNNLELRYQKKRELISALNPKLGEGVLIYTNDYTSKQIHAVPQIPIFENKNSNDVGTLKASVVFSCPNPYWEDIEETEVELPTNSLTPIENKGDVSVGVKLNIKTNLSGIYTIKNNNNDNIIKLTLADVLQDIKINTEVGQKSAMGRSLADNITFNNIENIPNINCMCYSKEKDILLLSTSYTGFFLYSKDGLNFTIIYTGSTQTIIDIAYSSTLQKFVAVGYGGTIIVSEDGIEWADYSLENDYNLLNVKYSNIAEAFIADGFTTSANSAIIFKSVDGETWVQVFEQTTQNVKYHLSKIAESEDVICIAGYKESGSNSYFILKSVDGTSWDQVDTTSITRNRIVYGVIYNKKLKCFIAPEGENSLIYSYDGSTWARIQVDVPSNSLIDINYIEEFGYMLSLKGYQSSSLIGWNKVTDDLNKVVFINSQQYFITSSIQNNYVKLFIMYQNFEKSIIKQSVTGTSFIAYISSLKTFISVGSNNAIKNKNEWEYITGVGTGVVIASNKNTGQIIIINDYNSVFESYDGINWESISTISRSFSYLGYSYKYNKYYGLGGKVNSSPDGKTWTENQSPSQYYYGFVSPMNNLMVVVGEYGYILTTLDGETFTRQTSGVNTDLKAVAYSDYDGIYVVVGNGGVILTSYDGVNWEQKTSGVNTNLNDIIYASDLNLFVAVGNNGVVLTSRNGIDWTQEESGTNTNIGRIAYSPDTNQFITAGFMLKSEITSDYENYISKAGTGLTLSLKKGINQVLISDNTKSTTKLVYRQKYIGV